MSTTDPVMNAYAQYDRDKRVNGPDDVEAFRDCLKPMMDVVEAARQALGAYEDLDVHDGCMTQAERNLSDLLSSLWQKAGALYESPETVTISRDDYNRMVTAEIALGRREVEDRQAMAKYGTPASIYQDIRDDLTLGFSRDFDKAVLGPHFDGCPVAFVVKYLYDECNVECPAPVKALLRCPSMDWVLPKDRSVPRFAGPSSASTVLGTILDYAQKSCVGGGHQ